VYALTLAILGVEGVQKKTNNDGFTKLIADDAVQTTARMIKKEE
jgi:hypothetical protein